MPMVPPDWLLVPLTDCWSPDWLLVPPDRLLVPPDRLLVPPDRLLVAPDWPLVPLTDYCPHVTGCWSPLTVCWSHLTGCWSPPAAAAVAGDSASGAGDLPGQHVRRGAGAGASAAATSGVLAEPRPVPACSDHLSLRIATPAGRLLGWLQTRLPLPRPHAHAAGHAGLWGDDAVRPRLLPQHDLPQPLQHRHGEKRLCHVGYAEHFTDTAPSLWGKLILSKWPLCRTEIVWPRWRQIDAICPWWSLISQWRRSSL